MADALSRYDVNSLYDTPVTNDFVDFDQIASKQKTDPELAELCDTSSLQFEEFC